MQKKKTKNTWNVMIIIVVVVVTVIVIVVMVAITSIPLKPLEEDYGNKYNKNAIWEGWKMNAGYENNKQWLNSQKTTNNHSR